MFALDISEQHIRVLELLKKKQLFSLQGLGQKEFTKQEEIPALLKELVAHTKPLPIVSRDIALVIPEEESFIKIVKVSRKEGNNLNAFLNEEIDKLLPYEKKEVYWDYQMGQTAPESGMIDITLIACPKPIVDSYIALVKKAGFTPSLIETEANALLWGIRDPFSPFAANEPTLAVNIGKKKTTVVIWAQGAIRFTSSVKLGMAENQIPDYLAMDWPQWIQQHKQEWAVTEKNLLMLTLKLREYIQYYNGHLAESGPKNTRELTKVVISGAWANIPELLTFLSKKLGIPAKKPEPVALVDPAYTIALGLALRGFSEEYNAS